MRSGSTSNTSKISTSAMKAIAERLMQQRNRKLTQNSYLNTWRRFNDFVIQLDVKPPTWEERAALFATYLIDKGIQSASVKSYMSAIKRILIDDGYQWNHEKVLISSLTRACRVINDKVRTQLPIQLGLLELLLFEVKRHFKGMQPYLETMYLALYAMCYYGLLQISEACAGPHVIKAMNVNVGINKQKIMLILYTSKMHGEESYPQEIKIMAKEQGSMGRKLIQRNFCPFDLVRHYMHTRRQVTLCTEQFFVFKDKSPISANHARNLLKISISNLGLNPEFYGMHSFRIGRCSDMIKYGATIEEAKRAGWWKSNAVYKYLRFI